MNIQKYKSSAAAMVAVFAAIFAAPFAAQASFLGDLAANPNVVSSSPYATGGDLVLKLGEAEYVHVFTNTASAATFTPSQALKARVLVVGGGGGGAVCNGSTYPGGAGGGGVVERRSVALAAGEYAVTVGAGGLKGMAASKGGNGKNYGSDGGTSSFVVSESDTISALGGGGGTRAAGRDGASPSGGAYASSTSCAPGSVLDSAQGNAGYPGHRMGGGGGGGAGGAAKAPYGTSYSDTKRYGSAGGDGRASGILGFVQYFGGGGGGASSDNTRYRTNPGGAGGGGTGGAAAQADTTDAYGGENGLGGGAGGVYQASNSGVAGKGGDGIVAIRYAVSATGAPVLRDVSVSCAGGASAAVAATVANAGTSDATVYFKAWPSSGSEDGAGTVAKTVGSARTGSAYVSLSPVLGGLSFDTAYDWKVWAANDAGSSAVATGRFSTHSTSLSATATGATETTLSGGLHKIFTFTESGTFTVPSGKTGFAKILVVGGGGAGGYGGGGGGGAGGVVYSPEVYLTNGTYAVTVGAGGTAPTTSGANEANKGGASSFGDFILAAGGGAGPNPSRVSNAANDGNVAGGSSAGTFSSRFSVSGTAGQGNAGGNGYLVSGNGQVSKVTGTSGGGGGAGTSGGDGSSAAGGAGGDGLACDITGETLYYGAGGGGSIYFLASGTGGAGGLGGGGAGGSVSSEPTERVGAAGTFYGAGGGSGALDSSNQAGAGGAGYQGVVIVRFTDYSQAGDDPLVEILSADDVTTDSATLAVSVPYAGTGASTVALTVTFAYEEGGAAVSSLTKTCSGFIGSQTLAVEGLCPGRTYYVTATADNGTATATATSSFTTAAMFSEALTYTSAGGVLGYTIDGAADGTQRLELWVGADAASLTNQAAYTDAALLVAGSHAIQPFTTEQFGESVAILLRHIALVDGIAFTNDTAVLSTTIQDGATYKWKSDVAEGDWCDAANWTSSGGMRGWPTAGSIAKFPNMTSTVRVDRAIEPGTVQFSAGGDWTFRGTADGASLRIPGSGDPCLVDGSYRFDALAVRVSAAQNGWLGNNQRIVLENGAALVSSKNLCLRTAGGSLLIGAGCSFAGNGLGGKKGAALVVSNGTATVSGAVNLSERGSAADLPASLSICGADARISCNGFYSEYTNATVTIELEGTYSSTEALIRGTGTEQMAKSGYALTFDVPKTSASKKVAKCDILVADWSKKSINTELVEFGEVDREGSYFYFTETADPKGTQYKSAEEVADAGATAKYLWYHHAPPSGMVIIVR